MTDINAIEYVESNNNAYIVNLHAATDPQLDSEVERVLQQYGEIIHKKSVYFNYNGYVNLKKLSYGSFWERNLWIGTSKNKFRGAREHVNVSMGFNHNPLRAYVFLCDSLDKTIKAKAEIRKLYDISYYAIHINDTHEEAIWLAHIYFNQNTTRFINERPFVFDDTEFDSKVDALRHSIDESHVDRNSVCVIGDAALNAFGCGKCDKVLETRPSCRYLEHYFYYRGLRFELPLQLQGLQNKRLARFNNWRWRIEIGCRHCLKFLCELVYKKRKDGEVRKVRMFGFIRFSYTRG